MRPASVAIKYDGITRAGLDALEERWDIYWRDFGRCQHCGESVTFETAQIAHRIANTKANRHRWGSDVIDSMENNVNLQVLKTIMDLEEDTPITITQNSNNNSNGNSNDE